MFETLHAAIDKAIEKATRLGWTVLDEVHADPMKYETSQSLALSLQREYRGKTQSRTLHVRLYRYHTGRYELVDYIS